MGMNACGCLGTSFSKAQSNRASTDASPSPSLGQRKQQDAHHLCAQQLEKLRHPQAALAYSLARVWLRNSRFLLRISVLGLPWTQQQYDDSAAGGDPRP